MKVLSYAPYIWSCSLLMMIPLLQAECPYQECDCLTTDILCLDQVITTLQLKSNVSSAGFKTLTLRRNQLTTITGGSLATNLTEIDIGDNPITNIEDSAFDTVATTLTTISITNAKLNRIPDAFRNLQNLEELNIDGVNIVDWNDAAMKNIGPTMRILYINNSNLTIAPTWLQYFCCLRELSILGSFLSSIPDGSMDKMGNTLESLTLVNNSLVEVPKAVSTLNIVSELYFAYNKISSTQWLPPSGNVMSLTLNGNRIYNSNELSNSLRPYSESLKDFELEDNELTVIPDISFLLHIESLNLENNRISDPSSGAMPPALYYLNLQNNNLPAIPRLMSNLAKITDMILVSNSIKEIQGDDFAPQATSVELGFNLITELKDNSFPENSIIEELYLNNNPISKISTDAFRSMPRLSQLDLRGTKMTRLPLALSSLMGLYNLDISDTTGLVCTCVEKGLERLVVSLGPDHMLGDCGQMTIYNFFATLSPGCPK